MRALVALSAFALFFAGVYADDSDWWKSMSLYQIYPRSFKDSDGDGIGDLKGIESKLQHLVDTGVDAFWISPVYPSPMVDFGYDISDYRDIDSTFGTLEDFEELLEAAHKKNLKVVMDFVPNHSSDQHEWFQKSVKKIEPYTDYYVWNDGKIVNGTRQPPNNWVSSFYGSAWAWNDERQAYYLHQFAEEQPDLNYRNERVVEEMKDVIRFWLDKGVDGLRVDAVPFLFEVEDLRDEPLTGLTSDPSNYSYTEHIYTNHLDEVYDMVGQWREVFDEYDSRVMMIEAYANLSRTMDYYTAGAHFPFNFALINSVDSSSSAEDFKNLVDRWMENMPAGATANWVAGNHDNSRLASRYGSSFAPVVTAVLQLLPGISVTYNGDEIGMEDTWLSWEETEDPQACNVGEAEYEEYSRDPERTPFQWDDTVAAGFSTNPKTWLRVNNNYKTVNLAAEKAADESYYKSFLKVTNLKKWPAVKDGSLETKLINNDVFAFARYLKNERSVYLLVNFAEEVQTVSLKDFENAPDKVEQYYSTEEAGVRSSSSISSDSLQIPARGAAVFISVD